ncbi:hypothetical protein EmuJ_000926400 [Echinococcus multilocularis]|uniref:Uncharacterized protein n=1 Tax=Echinococcus multilocularis TaxID=6211 RepID=A0A068YE62_ECHMU|nr:hypothetical protein EmuJ_000926400 [Echinococcus multilocularis]
MFAIAIVILAFHGCESLHFAQIEDDLRLRSLDLGPCVEEGDFYCSRRVPNSFCSVTKNECFCHPAFVAIQEEYGITCKPLLTSLNCHVDKDCVHVKNSICHPGAGFCACPGGTAYVAQEHACHNVAENSNNSFCETCKQMNGICYHAENSKKQEFGCACPFNTAMPLPQRLHASNGGPIAQWAFCKAILVDVGHLCNQEDLLCRPRNSECSSLNGGPKSCRCKPGFFPVYQQSLHYHECFKQVLCETKDIPECYNSGICVDLNGDGTPDDNFCARNGFTLDNQSLRHCLRESGERMSTSYSHNWPALDVILEENSEIKGIMEVGTQNAGVKDDYCRKPMVQVTCSSNRILVYFLPPTRPPYEQLHQSLVEGNAIAYLTGEGYAAVVIPRGCVLRLCDFGRDGDLLAASEWEVGHSRQFCVNLDLGSSPARPPCGLTLSRNETVVGIKGLLEVRTDAHVWSSSVDMRFDLRCSVIPTAATASATTTTAAAANNATVGSALTSTPRINSQERQTLPSQQEGSWSQRLSDQWNLDNVRPTPAALDLSFKAFSATKRAVSSVLLASPIQLKATLFDPTVTYNTFVVESCYATSVATTSEIMHVEIINRGCPNTECGFTGNFLSYSLSQPGRDGMPLALAIKSPPASSSLISIASSLFPAFVLTTGLHPNQSFRTDSSAFHANTTSTNVRITCAFRLCARQAWCALPHPCSGLQERNSMTTFMPPKIHFAVRSLILEIINPSPHEFEKSNSLGSQSCSSVFCQPRIQLLLIMVSLGTMLCLSMICGCLVSRNHYLFHLKSSSSSASSPNLTICHPHTNLLASRRSSDVPKTSAGIHPPRLGSQGGNDEISISTAFLHHEPEQNYIQFCNPPPPPQKHHHHTLPSTCFHEAYQSLSRQGHLQCSQSVFLSPQIDNRRGLIYANGEIGRGKSTLLVPVNSNSHLHSPHYLHSGTEWTWDGPEIGTFETHSAAQAATSTFIVDTAASMQQNNHSTAVQISTAPRQSGTGVENPPLCLIAASGIKTLGSAQKSPVPTPVTVAPETHYQLASKLYMMPDFSYCLSSHNTNNSSNNGYQNNGSEDESSQ